MNTQIQDLLNRSRKEHWQATGLENMIALVRCCRAFGNVIVTRDSQYAAPRRGARHVGMFEHVGATVHTWPLAIPNAKDAI